MTGSDPLLDLRTNARDLINKIGRDKAYIYNNTKYPDAPPLKHLDEEALIEVIVDMISQKYGQDGTVEVVIFEDPAIDDPNNKEKSIDGMYAYYPEYNSIYIVVNAKMNYCWRKFTTIKELCHVYMDFDDSIDHGVKIEKEHDYRVSLEKVFKETEKFKDFDFSSLDDIKDMGEEMYMVLLATELMIPIYDREEVMSMVSQIVEEPGNFTAKDIAKSLLMPEYILQKYIDLNAINSEPKYTSFN